MPRRALSAATTKSSVWKHKEDSSAREERDHSTIGREQWENLHYPIAAAMCCHGNVANIVCRMDGMHTASLVPRLLPSFLSHTVCDKKLGKSLETRLHMAIRKLSGYVGFQLPVPFSCFGGFTVSWMRYSVNLSVMKAGRYGSTITLHGKTRWKEVMHRWTSEGLQLTPYLIALARALTPSTIKIALSSRLTYSFGMY